MKFRKITINSISGEHKHALIPFIGIAIFLNFKMLPNLMFLLHRPEILLVNIIVGAVSIQ